jgi:hypothetical protein
MFQQPLERDPVFDIRTLPDELAARIDIADRIFRFYEAQAVSKTRCAAECRSEDHFPVRVDESTGRDHTNFILPFLDSGEAFGKIPYQCESAFDHNHSVASNKAITVLPLDYSTTFTKTIGVIEGTVKRELSRSIDKPVLILADPYWSKAFHKSTNASVRPAFPFS